jgi:branched-chain amino acid transport system ATP-binding protein
VLQRSPKPFDSPGLECNAVYAMYGSLTACRDVTLSVRPGEVVGLIGPNGAGKTSLVGAISGLVASRGAVSLGGGRLDAHPAHRRAQSGLATVPDTRGLFAPFSVAENIKLGAQWVAKQERNAAVDRAVTLFPFLRDRWSATAGSLSGGEQQMLAIAKSLASLPLALVLDEPSQGLAPVIVEKLAHAIAELRKANLPVLLVEQNHSLVEATVDRFAVMVSGRIVLEEPKAGLADHDRLARLFLATTDKQ